MNWLIVSDSHRNLDVLETLSNKYPNMDNYIHLGDSEREEQELLPFYSVEGNCDYFHYPLFRIIPCAFGNILLTHRPLVDRDIISKYKPKIIIHGHTHIPNIELKDNILRLCPGSLVYPRSKYGETYMILNINKEQISVKIYGLSDDKLLMDRSFNI